MKNSKTVSRTRRVGLLLGKLALGLFATSLLLVLVFRWLPVPYTAFMLQKTVTAVWTGDERFRFRHDWVSSERISPQAKIAVVAAEDQRFPDHFGFDFEALAAAWEHNQSGGRLRGGSTISQQLAKNLFLWPGRSLARKGLEACITGLIELAWPKERILEVYLNVVEFGPGIFGIEAAAQAYFNKPAARLSAREAALLAAVLPNPRRFRVDRPSRYVLARQERILRHMYRLGGPGYLRDLG